MCPSVGSSPTKGGGESRRILCRVGITVVSFIKLKGNSCARGKCCAVTPQWICISSDETRRTGSYNVVVVSSMRRHMKSRPRSHSQTRPSAWKLSSMSVSVCRTLSSFPLDYSHHDFLRLIFNVFYVQILKHWLYWFLISYLGRPLEQHRQSREEKKSHATGRNRGPEHGNHQLIMSNDGTILWNLLEYFPRRQVIVCIFVVALWPSDHPRKSRTKTAEEVL